MKPTDPIFLEPTALSTRKLGWVACISDEQEIGAAESTFPEFPRITVPTMEVTLQQLDGPVVYKRGELTVRLEAKARALVAIALTTWRAEVQAIEGAAEFAIAETTLTLPPMSTLKLTRDIMTGCVLIELNQGTATLLIAHASATLVSGTMAETGFMSELGAATIKAIAGPPVTVTANGMSAIVPAGSGTLLVVDVPPTFYLDHVRIYGKAHAAPEGNIVLDIRRDSPYSGRLVEVLRDIVLVGIAYYGAYLLRWDADLPSQQWTMFTKTLLLVVLAQIACLLGYGAYRRLWRYAGIDDVLVIAKSACTATVISALTVGVSYGYPRPFIAIFVPYMMLVIILVGGSRVVCKLCRDLLSNHAHGCAKPNLVRL